MLGSARRASDGSGWGRSRTRRGLRGGVRSGPCFSRGGGHIPNPGSDLCAFLWFTVGSQDTFPCLHPVSLPVVPLQHFPGRQSRLSLSCSESHGSPHSPEDRGWVWNRQPPASLLRGLLSPQAALDSATPTSSRCVGRCRLPDGHPQGRDPAFPVLRHRPAPRPLEPSSVPQKPLELSGSKPVHPVAPASCPSLTANLAVPLDQRPPDDHTAGPLCPHTDPKAKPF